MAYGNEPKRTERFETVGPATVRGSDVPEALNELNIQVTQLHDAFGTLLNRLAPALRSSTPVCTEENRNNGQGMCELGYTVRTESSRVAELEAMVRDTINRLEI